MKRKQAFLSFLLVCAALLILGSCGSNQSTDSYTPYTPGQIARVIISAQADIAPMQYLTPEDDFFWEYLSNFYQLDVDRSEVVDGVIFYAGGIIADEIAVFLFADSVDTNVVSEALTDYINRRMVAFSGYAPEQVALLGSSIVSVHANHVALLIAPDAQGAQSTFLACFSDNPPELPESIALLGANTPAENEFDADSILFAWNTGDTSVLSEKNARIFDMAAYVIGSVITDDMDDFERQSAIHDWIIYWADYDTEVLSNAPDAAPDPDNDNPYGLFFSRVAICTGFSYTFQLLMNLVGIETITVHGYNTLGGEHAWNLVRIDGEWYFVDVTWNNTVGNNIASRRFFNVTSQYMWDEVGHRWDRDSVPEATALRQYN